MIVNVSTTPGSGWSTPEAWHRLRTVPQRPKSQAGAVRLAVTPSRHRRGRTDVRLGPDGAPTQAGHEGVDGSLGLGVHGGRASCVNARRTVPCGVGGAGYHRGMHAESGQGIARRPSIPSTESSTKPKTVKIVVHQKARFRGPNLFFDLRCLRAAMRRASIRVQPRLCRTWTEDIAWKVEARK